MGDDIYSERAPITGISNPPIFNKNISRCHFFRLPSTSTTRSQPSNARRTRRGSRKGHNRKDAPRAIGRDRTSSRASCAWTDRSNRNSQRTPNGLFSRQRGKRHAWERAGWHVTLHTAARLLHNRMEAPRSTHFDALEEDMRAMKEGVRVNQSFPVAHAENHLGQYQKKDQAAVASSKLQGYRASTDAMMSHNRRVSAGRSEGFWRLCWKALSVIVLAGQCTLRRIVRTRVRRSPVDGSGYAKDSRHSHDRWIGLRRYGGAPLVPSPCLLGTRAVRLFCQEIHGCLPC